MNRPLIYIEFKPNQIPYVNGFDIETIKDYLIDQKDSRGYYGLFNNFDIVFKKISTVTNKDLFYYPVIVSMRKVEHQLDKIEIPLEVVEKVRYNQAKILIVCPFEGWEWPYWNKLAAILKKKYNLENNHIVMLTGNYYENNIHKSVVYNHWENINNDSMNNNDRFLLGINSLPKLRKNKFICLNRRPSAVRYAAVTLLYDLKDQGILTCAKSAGYNEHYISNQYFDFQVNFPELYSTFKENIEPIIPLTYNDGVNPEVENPAYDSNKDKFYDSYLYIVTETWFLEKETLFLSEKTFKPITFLQPFIIIGSPGTLDLLRRLGYKTFNDFWDESYDDELDHNKRLYKVIETARSIISKTPEELSKMMVSMQPILEHNFKNLVYRKSIQYTNLRDDLYKALD